MLRLRMLVLLGTFLPALVGMANAQSRNLDIYWIDVEGGAATLIVTPSGESLLYDAGYAVDDRDAKRIYAATQQAGLKKIDSFVLSHYHGDHVGGLPALASGTASRPIWNSPSLVPLSASTWRSPVIMPEGRP